MHFGIFKYFKKVNILLSIYSFQLRKFVYGFDNANAYFRRLDKDSVMPILLKNGATIGVHCDIEAPLIFHNCQDFSNLIIGNNCHIGKNCFFDLREKVIIENNVVISMQCTFITHIDMNNSKLSMNYPSSQAPIFIGENVYIGANSTILHGVRLEKKSLIATGSVVLKNVPTLTMVGGVPAKLLKKIFLEDKC